MVGLLTSKINKILLLGLVLVFFTAFAIGPLEAAAQTAGADPAQAQATPGAQNGGGGANGGAQAGDGGGNDEPSGLGAGDAIESFIYSVTTGIGGAFVWIGGGLLDYSIHYLVIGMGSFLSTNLGVVVDQMWVVVRDFFNILFIFGLIYIGFRTILFSGDTGTKKAVGLLVIAALMINFSLFITKAIIDFSNIAALQVYNAIVSEPVAGQERGQADAVISGERNLTLGGPKDTVPSVSASFMNAIKLTTYADKSALQEMRNGAEWLSGQFILFGIVMMFFMIFAAFIFLAGAFILIMRFVVLVVAMILSPMMFLGLIFPKLGHYAIDWWKKFLSHAFVAPAYLFMLYLSLWSISGIADPEGGSFAGAFKGDSMITGMFFIFLYFFVVTFFLLMSLQVAKKMSVHGSGAAIAATQMVRSGIGAASFGLAARGMRNTVGYGADRLANSTWLKNKVDKGGAPQRWLARSVKDVSQKTADNSFDVRDLSFQGVNVGQNMGLGTGKGKGFRTISDEITQKEKRLSDSLGEVSDDDPEVQKLTQNIKQTDQKIKEQETKIKEIDVSAREAIAEENKKQSTLRAKLGGLDNKSEEAAQVRDKIAESQTTVENIRSEQAKVKEGGEKAIKKLQDEKAKLEAYLKREKKRRQIGSQVDIDKYNEAEKSYKDAAEERDKVKGEYRAINNKLWAVRSGVDTDISEYLESGELEDYNKLSSIEKWRYRTKRMSEINDLAKKQYRKYAEEAATFKSQMDRIRAEGSFGHANVLASSGHIESGLVGRLANQDQRAGRSILQEHKEILSVIDKIKEKEKS